MELPGDELSQREGDSHFFRGEGRPGCKMQAAGGKATPASGPNHLSPDPKGVPPAPLCSWHSTLLILKRLAGSPPPVLPPHLGGLETRLPPGQGEGGDTSPSPLPTLRAAEVIGEPVNPAFSFPSRPHSPKELEQQQELSLHPIPRGQRFFSWGGPAGAGAAGWGTESSDLVGNGY